LALLPFLETKSGEIAAVAIAWFRQNILRSSETHDPFYARTQKKPE